MKNIYVLFILILVTFFSCGANKNTSNSSYNKSSSSSKIVQSAKKYLGTPYKFGGNTKKGIDCSGLVCNAYADNGKKIPRVSREQATFSKKISLNRVQSGDLLFFAHNGNRISHVGIVESVQNGEVFFIHASTSKGVIISSLDNVYWKPRFRYAGRID